MDQAKYARTPMATDEKLNLDKAGKLVSKRLSRNDFPFALYYN